MMKEYHFIRKVYHMKTDTVIVFDERGEQLTAYCGKFNDVIAGIGKHATPATKFFVQGHALPITKEAFVEKRFWKKRR